MFWANHSFALSDLSDMSESLRVPHLSWATWAICSRSLISSERPERFAHGRSFVLSDLSESLTVAHLIWVKWANERWANEQIPSPKANPSGSLINSLEWFHWKFVFAKIFAKNMTLRSVILRRVGLCTLSHCAESGNWNVRKSIIVSHCA